jgi:hypothetical protein
MTPAPSSAEAPGFSRSGRRRFRLPCGHVAREAAVGARLRVVEAAAWLPCVACNVIVIAVAGTGRRRRRP